MTTLKRSPSFGLAVMMGVLCLILFMVRIASASDMSAQGVRTIDRDLIRLSDVFPGVLSMNDKVLGPAPTPGDQVTLDTATLMKLASAYGVLWTPTSTTDQIVIKRLGAVIDQESQAKAVENALTPFVQGKFNVIFDAPLSSVSLKSSDSTDFTVTNVTVDPRNDTFKATMKPVAQGVAPRVLSGCLERLMNVPTVRAAISRGATITAGDLDVIEMKVADLRGDIVVNADQIAGRAARQNLTPGRLIRLSDTEVPVSIKRGQKINLVYKVGQLELTSLGRAMEDGRVGDRIRVTNGETNKALQGTVLATNQVEIDQ